MGKLGLGVKDMVGGNILVENVRGKGVYNIQQDVAEVLDLF